MANLSAACPFCTADVPLEVNQQPGDEVYCSYCHAPLIARKVDRFTWVCVDIDEDKKSANKKAAKRAEQNSEEEGIAKSFLELDLDEGGGGHKGGH